MSFNDDVLKSIDDFRNNIDTFQINVTDYNQTFENYKNEYRDINLLKEKMKDVVAKAVFISELYKEEDDDDE